MKIASKTLFFICFYSLIASLYGQDSTQKYWVFFQDKDTSNYDYKTHLSLKTIQNRKNQQLDLVQFSDIPLTSSYTKIVGKHTQIVCQSKWLNAVSVLATVSEVQELHKYKFIKNISQINTNLKITKFAPNFDKNKFGEAISEMNPEAFLDAKLTAKNITIGVIDAGFYGANTNSYLKHLFEGNKILAVKDLVNPEKTKHFTRKDTDSDDHGTTVLKMITGKNSKQQQEGFASDAQFYLARTDDGEREFRGEEDYWISAMEWMDSLGVRLINTSLGYSFDFDDPNEDYKPEEMNGKTSKITKMAQLASKEKGILIVVSAGNEGFGDWKVLSAPADAEGVLSVGATNGHRMKAYYSSIGTESLSYIKPEVSCYSASGTSFSAPMITGFAGCLMQKMPKASVQKIKQIIEQSSHLYPYGNNYIGYGIPDAKKSLQIIDNKYFKKPDSVKTKEEFTIIPNPKTPKENLIIFHKKDAFRVVKQSRKNINKNPVNITRSKGVKRTTVVYGEQIFEIFWKE